MFAKKAERAYLNTLNTPGIFQNTTDTALPQTAVAKAVQQHFAKETDKVKKALLIGFDGARADSMHLLCESENKAVTGNLFCSAYSAVNALKAEGGLYLSFAGGVPSNPQETSTAQGWSAILTGVWGDDNGVKQHKPLRRDCPTVLRALAENGKSTAFLAEWPDHFTVTYKDEIEIAKHENLPLLFEKFEDDRALLQGFLREIAAGKDCIFGIFEAPDCNGHSTGFSNVNPRYAAGVCRLDNVAFRLLEAVKARPTYAREDWLILITSDHGGHARRHGTQKPYDRMTFIASNKEISE
ncbi:MAG: alkaline phosphatase family protein [Candidatus Fimenecus sp.]